MAHLVHAEAGTQPFIGQVAVAAVVLNRVKAPGFPKSIPQVIEEPGQFEHNARAFPFPGEAGRGSSGWRPLGRLPGFFFCPLSLDITFYRL